MYARKGQIEFVVILGVVFVVIVVIYYAFQAGTFPRTSLPSDVKKLQGRVQERVERLLREGSKIALYDMETHGGYVTREEFVGGGKPLDEFVLFMGEGVPFWQKCQNDISPTKEQIKRTFEVAVKRYMENHTREFLDMFGKGVSFDVESIDVKSDILSDKVVVTLIMPTTVEGYKIQDPYRIEIGTKFGEIIDFAKDASKELSEKRKLDYFTIYSIYFAKSISDGYPKLPTIGTINLCGDTIYRSPSQIEEFLMEVAVYVMKNTLWWSPISTDASKSKVFGIETVNGKRYMDLDINMYLPDDFAFNTSAPVVITNPKLLVAAPPFVLSECMAVYNNAYRVSYPVVISVDDPLLGGIFNFAGFVHVVPESESGSDSGQRMVPGTCSAVGIPGNEGPGGEMPQCNARIRVMWHKDSGENVPLEGARVAYGDNYIGSTDENGYAQGKIECEGNAVLSIFYNTSFGFYIKKVSASSVSGTYFLHKKPDMNVHFRKVDVKCFIYSDDEYEPGWEEWSWGCNSNCDVYECSVSDMGSNLVMAELTSVENPSEKHALYNIKSVMDPDCASSSVCDECFSNADESEWEKRSEACRQCSAVCRRNEWDNNVEVNYIPGGRYRFDVTSININSGYYLGKFDGTYRIPENAENLYLYVPYIGRNTYFINDYEKACMKNVVENRCGISLIGSSAKSSLYYTKGDSRSIIKSVTEIMKKCSALTESDINSVRCWGYSHGSYPSGCYPGCDEEYESCGWIYNINALKSVVLSRCGINLVVG